LALAKSEKRESNLRHAVLSWSLLAAYCLLIFVQSSFPSPDMGPELPGQDKLIHLAAYAVLGVLACRAFATLPCLKGTFVLFMAAFIFTLVFGLSDEWHQSFVPGRMADGWDLLADAAGALLGAAGYCWRYGARAVRGPTFPR
jgi:VanZ family protein